MLAAANGSRSLNEENPWLRVPAEHYDGHMAHPDVGQSAFLATHFGDLLAEFRPRRAALLGCATGNGLEFVNPQHTEHLLALDLNPDYLALVAARHGDALGGVLSTRRVDLRVAGERDAALPPAAFDLIHAALLFEYLDPAALLPALARSLAPGGRLAVVLQLPGIGHGAVSDTPFVGVRVLEPLLELVAPPDFAAAACAAGLVAMRREMRVLSSGKGFELSLWGAAP